MDYINLLDDICNIASQAGRAIMDIYQTDDFCVQVKEDNSPLTKADLTAHNIICEGLNKLDSTIPILSEESDEITYQTRSNWNRFWLVDPLDGTKEFIKRNGEFTVNIALIENSNPVLGVVFAPVLNKLYCGHLQYGAWLKEGGQPKKKIKVADKLIGDLKVVASRSHRSEELENYLLSLPSHQCIAMGSSLKLCLVAQGEAHLYPRIGPTMEWDTAAADAVVRSAGGQVTDLNGENLKYNKENLLNPYFIVHSKVI